MADVRYRFKLWRGMVVRTFLLTALAAIAIGCSRPQPAAAPLRTSRPTEAHAVDKPSTSNATAEREVRSGTVIPLTPAQQDELLNSRVEGGMQGSFGQFANMF